MPTKLGRPIKLKRGPKKLKNRRQVPETPHISEEVGPVNLPLEIMPKKLGRPIKLNRGPKKLKDRRQVPETPHISEEVGPVNLPLEIIPKKRGRPIKLKRGPKKLKFRWQVPVTPHISEEVGPVNVPLKIMPKKLGRPIKLKRGPKKMKNGRQVSETETLHISEEVGPVNLPLEIMLKKRGRPNKLENTQVPKTPHISEEVDPVNVPLDVCRLCETEVGPFFNIFSSEITMTKKIQELMPFVVTEDDDLPNKVCFRCSAQVEVLHEFIHKCINTQKKLRVTVDKRVTSLPKTENRAIEVTKCKDSLQKSHVITDVVCDAVIKKVMECVIDLTAESDAEKSSLNGAEIAEQNSLSCKSMKETLHIENLTKTTNPEVESNKKQTTSNNLLSDADRKLTRSTRSNATKPLMNNPDTECDTKIMGDDSEQNSETNNSKHESFCIMDFVAKFKINGWGILFQCELCNRNFMKKGAVLSHGCAKNGTPKDFVPPKSALPQPPKVSTNKYINTKQDNTLISVSKNAGGVIHEPYHKVEKSKTATKTIMSELRTGRASEGSRKKCVPVVGIIVSPKNHSPPKQSTRRQSSKSGGRNCNDSKAAATGESSAECSNYNVAQKPEERACNETLNQKAQPYPIGLFQAAPHNYTIIQTDNPNELLISSKPKRQAQHITAESPAKKERKRSPKKCRWT